MKKQNLLDGMVVQLRNGKHMLVLSDILFSNQSFVKLGEYKQNLKHEHYKELDIVKVYSKTSYRTLGQIDTPQEDGLIWSEPELVTIAQILEQGKPFKYVDIDFEFDSVSEAIDYFLKQDVFFYDEIDDILRSKAWQIV